MALRILGGGAAQGLVNALVPAFMAESDVDVTGTFGAVGAMRATLLAGTPADLLILTAALITDLARDGHVAPGTARDVGTVRTAIAVRDDQPAPPIGDADQLGAALLAADALYIPDTTLSTAGIHVARVLDRLGLTSEMAPRLRSFPTGTVAMRELARAGGRPIGCTQATEILATPGIRLVGPLPAGLELATVYTVGVCAKAAEPELARRFVSLLTGDDAAATRARLGFEPVA